MTHPTKTMEEAGEHETAKPVACYALLSGCTRFGEIPIGVVCTTTNGAIARDFHHAGARFWHSGRHPTAVFSDA
jgi:hypothetical protein